MRCQASERCASVGFYRVRRRQPRAERRGLSSVSVSGEPQSRHPTPAGRWSEFSAHEAFAAVAPFHWGGREFELRPASTWRERYALVENQRELALLDAKSWGKRPVTIELADPTTVPPGLLLFAAFAARQLADDASAAAGGVAAVAATG